MDFKVNINESVKVKVNELGKSILINRRKELNERIESRGGKGLGEFQLKTDDEGYTTFQLWELMNTFGAVLTMGFEVPFETDIIIKNGKQL
jgi:hypothetical protein